jgi:hypothetical protein
MSTTVLNKKMETTQKMKQLLDAAVCNRRELSEPLLRGVTKQKTE